MDQWLWKNIGQAMARKKLYMRKLRQRKVELTKKKNYSHVRKWSQLPCLCSNHAQQVKSKMNNKTKAQKLQTSENTSASRGAKPLISPTSPDMFVFSSSSSISLVTDRTKGG